MAKHLREILPLDELKKSTLASYVKARTDKIADTAWQTGEAYAQGRRKAMGDWSDSTAKGQKGVERAADRLAGEYKSKIKGPIAPFKPGMKVRKYHAEETELDEAKRATYKRKGSMRAQVKSQADIAKEKNARRKLAKATIKSGQKVKFQKFGRWSSKRKAGFSEDLQELSHNVLGRYVKKAEKEDNYNLSPEHKKGINLALRKRGEHKYTEIVPPRVRASRNGKKR